VLAVGSVANRAPKTDKTNEKKNDESDGTHSNCDCSGGTIPRMKNTNSTVGKNTQTMPIHGAANPSTFKQGTSPGSFALEAHVGGATTYSSPDTPGMPAPSTKTAHDMAPNTTGNRTIDHHGSVRLCHTALDIAATLLRPKGNLVMKVLEGEAYKELLDRCESCFAGAKGFKPKASRAISTEMFVVCTGRREDMPNPMDVAPASPTSGWK